MGRYLLFFQLNDQPLITLSTLPNGVWGNQTNNNIKYKRNKLKSTKIESGPPHNLILKTMWKGEHQMFLYKATTAFKN